MENNYLFLKNGCAANFDTVPLLHETKFSTACLQAILEDKCRISAFFAIPGRDEQPNILVAVLADPIRQGLRILKGLIGKEYHSLTAQYAGFNRFERDIYESCGIIPEGHPNLKPLRFTGNDIGEMEYFGMEGKEIHEVAVGPVHAGVIEPGHFRFECMGETVYSLEISLGYQHRGVEKLLFAGPDKRSIHLIETAAGDSSIAAAWNYTALIEALGSITVAPQVNILRQVALELERCANHIGDLGALAGDVAFLPTASFCGRIRGEYLNMSADLCGNRFGRNFIVPGSCRYGVDAGKIAKLHSWLKQVSAELWNALELMFNSPTVLDRFENTGTVTAVTAVELGLVGVAARACGLPADSRTDLPRPGSEPLPQAAGKFTGDVLSRARVRYEELKISHKFLFSILDQFPQGIEVPPETGVPELMPGAIAVSVTEAWRGELCHVILTDRDGKFRQVKITDPSLHNWEGLAMALRNEEIAHFPICNKSFNLSYCGHDL
ncbi:MAG: NADH-quinone oxidoreductase subunit C [Lentisphaeria bacterium]|nr:NADH-quinone oxidoreductase subunit C [Lentisphaeria bacterium]